MSLFKGLELGKNVSSFKDKVGTAMSGVRENTLTVTDTTLAKMKEGVSLISKKDTEITGVISGYKTTVVEQLDGVVGALSSGKLNVKDLTNVIKVGPDGVYLDQKGIVGKASRLLGMNFNDKSSALSQIASMANKEFKAITGLNLGNFVTSDGQSIRLTGNWRDKLGSETLKQVSKITGISDYLDVSARSAIQNAIFGNAAKYGMSTRYKDIWNSYPKGFEKVRRDAALNILGNLIDRGDVVSIESMIDLLEKEGKNVVLSRYPNMVTTIFSKFTFDKETHPSEYENILERLKSLLEMLMGEEWYFSDTSFGEAYNLTMFRVVSKDMRLLLSMWDEIGPLLCTVGMFRDRSAILELKLAFKNTAQFER